MKKKVCFVVSTPMTAKAFLLEHIDALSEHYQVALIANFQGGEIKAPTGPAVRIFDVPIAREISPAADLIALAKLYQLFKAERFDAVHSVTPKAGLLAMMAAKAAGIPHRFHIFTGQVWATRTGMFRRILKTLDRVIVASASAVLVDSPSQRDFLVSQGVLADGSASVLGDGSISGVDTRRFHPDAEQKAVVRASHNLPADAFVFLFLGRFNREKGVAELVEAFARLDYVHTRAYLLVVGPEEENVLAGHADMIAALGDHFVRVGYTSEPEKYMAAADVFCLPSHREGFGSVILEAAAAGVPALGSNIYGISDAIDNGVTGLLHEKGNVDDLALVMQRCLDDRSLVAVMGANAAKRVQDKFLSSRIVREMVAFYRDRV